ncbi:MAG: hypothetical protein ACI4TZ_03255 [Christensenellales bacterium]
MSNLEYIKQAIKPIAQIQANNNRLIKHIKQCFEYLEQGTEFVASFLEGYDVGLNTDINNCANNFGNSLEKLNFKNDVCNDNLQELEQLNKQSEMLSQNFDKKWSKLKRNARN